MIGIDATNLRGGGGRTHLVELLRAANPGQHGIERVVVWGAKETLELLDSRTWMDKRNPAALDGPLLRRMLWQKFQLGRAARRENCALVFVPGGTYQGGFEPVVTMCRNLLPFEWPELRRYGLSRVGLRLLLLRVVQSRTFRRSTGIIFLTHYAKQQVLEVSGAIGRKHAIIPHGINPRFLAEPRPQRDIAHYSTDHPFRLLYVSIVDNYKHQWSLVEAVAQLRREMNWPLALDLIGPAYPPALRRLRRSLSRCDPGGEWVTYHGRVPYSELHLMYARADVGAFLSSCENLPNILIETMAAGLPVACSNRPPMPEVLRDAGVYFDPEDPREIASALKGLIASPEMRTAKAAASRALVDAYSWEDCAHKTFQFLAEVARPLSKARPACVAS